MTGSTLPKKYIIEHTSRGVLMSQVETGPFEYRSKFSHTKSRIEGMVFDSLEKAKWALSRLPDPIRLTAQILRWGSWTVVDRAASQD